MSSRRTIIASVRKELMERKQCANNPFNAAPGCKEYMCPLWRFNYGFFDESGFQIDHIVEVTHGGTNEITNLQVLCPCCHAVKTKRCAKQGWEFTSAEIDYGRAKMVQDPPLKPLSKKRRNSQ
jgi:5-methylcytosine-specific restriction endonuclease McrA